MIKIQLEDMARAWWLVEAARLEKPNSWDQSSEDFYKKILLCNGSEGNEGMIYQVAVRRLNNKYVHCKIPKAQSVSVLHSGRQGELSKQYFSEK